MKFSAIGVERQIDVSNGGKYYLAACLSYLLHLYTFTLYTFTLFQPLPYNLGSLGVYGVLIILYFLIHMNYPSTRVYATHESRIE